MTEEWSKTRRLDGPGFERRSVLHVTQPATEGVPKRVLELVEHQVSVGLRVGLACPPHAKLVERAESIGATVLVWPSTRHLGPGLVSETLRLRRLAREFEPSIVHLHSSKAGLTGRMAMRGRVPTVFQPHGWSFLAVTGRAERAAIAWERFVTRWTQAMILVSEGELGLALEHRIGGMRQVVIPNTIELDPSGFNVADRREAARQALGIEDEPVVACVGRLCEQKGQDILLAAWSEVHAAVPAARLLLVGDGPSRATLEATSPANVLFLGDRDDVPALLHAVDVVAMPSRWEGMSISMLEAMAAGKPVVASSVAGVAETIGVGGGVVVNVGDHAGMAKAIINRLVDPALAAAEGHVAREIVRTRHRPADGLSDVIRLYEDLLDVSITDPAPRARTPGGPAQP